MGTLDNEIDARRRAILYTALCAVIPLVELAILIAVRDLAQPALLLTAVSLLFLPYDVALICFAMRRDHAALGIARGAAFTLLLISGVTLLAPLMFFVPLVIYLAMGAAWTLPLLALPIWLNYQLHKWTRRALEADEELPWSSWNALPAVWVVCVVLAIAAYHGYQLFTRS